MIPLVTVKEVEDILKSKFSAVDVVKYIRWLFSDLKNFETFCKFFYPDYFYRDFDEPHYILIDWLNSKTNGAIALPRGVGKAQRLDCNVLTPTGWKKIGNIKKGDYVISSNGKKTKVKEVHPIHKIELFELKTRDGRKTYCSGNHLWNVITPQNKGHKEYTTNTFNLFKNYKKIRLDKRTGKNYIEYKHFIDTCKPIEFNKKDYLIDPYTLGIWLGDGHSASGRVTNPDEEIFEYIPYPVKKHKNCINYNISDFTWRLRKLNLLHNKHIPKEYLFGSIKQRESLLQGLIDSDGYIYEKGTCFQFSTKRENLKDEFVELVRSLGGTCTVKYKKIKLNDKIFYCYIINCRIHKSIIPCKLKRKRNIWKESIKTKTAIISIKSIGEDYARCITIEDELGTYITDDYLVTHNSTVVGLGFVSWCALYEKKRYILYVSKNHSESVQFLEPLSFEFKNNKLIEFIYSPQIGKIKETDSGKDREDMFDINNKVRIRAQSFEKPFRGLKFKNRRPDLVILDDIEKDERVINPVLRSKDARKLNNQIIPGMDPEVGQYKFIGTILHLDSLLIKKLNLLNGKIISAEDENGEPTFPNTYSKEKLEEKKKEIGTLAYRQEYLNNPVSDETSIIKEEWVRNCFNENYSYMEIESRFDLRVLGHDPAFSDAITADNTALAGLGYKDSLFTLFYAKWLHGLSILEQLDYIKILYKAHKYSYIAHEENSIKSISKEFKDKIKYPYKLFWTGTSDDRSKLKSEVEFNDKRHSLGKKNLIFRLASRFETKQIILPYKTARDKETSEKILSELVSWSLYDGKIVEAGIHPDMPIAIALACELIEMYVNTEVYVGGLDL